MPQSTDYGLDRGTSLLKVYPHRSLSFYSDALNAIMGILKSFCTGIKPIGSIWVVPFRDCLRSDEEADLRLCLHWGRWSSSTRRRHGFPTWSPLAWERADIRFSRTQYPLMVTSMLALWEGCDHQYSTAKDSEVLQDLQLTAYIV